MNGEKDISVSTQDPARRETETHFQSRHREGEIKTSTPSDNESGLNLKKAVISGFIAGATFFGINAVLGRFFKDDE